MEYLLTLGLHCLSQRIKGVLESIGFRRDHSLRLAPILISLSFVPTQWPFERKAPPETKVLKPYNLKMNILKAIVTFIVIAPILTMVLKLLCKLGIAPEITGPLVRMGGPFVGGIVFGGFAAYAVYSGLIWG
jgi:hypothetical protein